MKGEERQRDGKKDGKKHEKKDGKTERQRLCHAVTEKCRLRDI
jgi:hypothetical protein